MLRKYPRILLALTLGLLVLGLAAHSLPIPSLCACVSPANDAGYAASMDACLACLLHTGIYIPGFQQLNKSASLPRMVEFSGLSARELHLEITHPPTLA
ncbi:MAG: hypothetical protein A2Z16_02050 [Chloroflexi bacterium RBG_16_54_18]|nr:MAG: hypothetical protein A2Z16_02050 [Chloroflexi bacterium RBG_16_54_18]